MKTYGKCAYCRKPVPAEPARGSNSVELPVRLTDGSYCHLTCYEAIKNKEEVSE